MNEWIQNSLVNNQLWLLRHPEPNDTGDKSGVPQKKGEKKKSDGKENPYEKCLYSYANKELKSCGPSCRG